MRSALPQEHAQVRVREQSPGNLTLVHLQATFGHVAHAALGLLGAEHGEIVQERGLGSDLEVADGAVALRVVGAGRSTPTGACSRAPSRPLRPPPSPAPATGPPCHRGRQCWCRGQRRAAGRRCWCPAPAGTAAPPAASVETGRGDELGQVRPGWCPSLSSNRGASDPYRPSRGNPHLRPANGPGHRARAGQDRD